jgi:crossover junction endodeoxyribonuclease RusA
MIHPPDNRRRDLDNVLKAVLDAIEAAGIIEDDSQVRRLELAFGDCVDGGSVTITIGPIRCDTQC